MTPTNPMSKYTMSLRSNALARGAIAVMGFVALSLLALLPTLVHGAVLGPFDFLSLFGLGHTSGVSVYNTINSDLVQQDLPWMNVAWHQVHQGHLPLWNPYSGLGMPLGLDFITESFSVPMLISYLVPLRYGLLIAVMVKMTIAGSGVFILSRVCGQRYLSAFFAGALFELSGAFTVWLGWSQSGVMEWAGWLLAAVILILGGRRRVRSVVFFAVVLALSVYGGQPEENILLAVASGVVVLVVLVDRAIRSARVGTMLTPLLDLALGAAGGVGLSAPLWLPGTQITAGTARFATRGEYGALPFHYLVNLAFNGFYGFPVRGSEYFAQVNYYEVTSYVGVVVLVLAALGVIECWRRVEVKATVIMAVVMVLVAFVGPVSALVDKFPHGGGIEWNRDVMLVALALAVLAGFGVEALWKGATSRRLQLRFGIISAGAGVGLCALWLRGVVYGALTASQAHIRERSFLWQVVGVVGCWVVLVAIVLLRKTSSSSDPGGDRLDAKRCLALRRERGSLAAAVLIAVLAVGFLASSNGPLWSGPQHYFTKTPAEVSLIRAVGSGTVGFGGCASVGGYADAGILPEANAAYGVHEISFYDTTAAPLTYYKSWAVTTGQPESAAVNGVFCPSMTSASLARHYGVEFILDPPGLPRPKGTVLDTTIAGEKLYRVPGAAPVTLSARQERSGQVGPVTHPTPAVWRFDVKTRYRVKMHIRLTDVPGWHATIDGRPLQLDSWNYVMMQAEIPPGNHVVVLNYWPSKFTLGLVIAVLSAIVIVVASIVGWRALIHANDVS